MNALDQPLETALRRDRLVVVVALGIGPVVAGLVVGRVLLARLLLGLALRLQRLRDERIVLGSQIRLVGLGAGHEGVALGTVRGQLVIALEGANVAHGNVQLMRDPGVCPTLAYPRTDLVELRLQRSPCQTAPETTNTRPENHRVSAPETVPH